MGIIGSQIAKIVHALANIGLDLLPRRQQLLIAENEVAALAAFQPQHARPHALNLLEDLVGVADPGRSVF